MTSNFNVDKIKLNKIFNKHITPVAEDIIVNLQIYGRQLLDRVEIVATDMDQRRLAPFSAVISPSKQTKKT